MRTPDSISSFRRHLRDTQTRELDAEGTEHERALFNIAYSSQGIPPERGVTYLLSGPHPNDPVKIGTTRNLGRRIHQMRTGCPFPLVLRGQIPGMHWESQLHTLFSSSRLHNEWFWPDAPGLRPFVQSVWKFHPDLNRGAKW